MHLTRPEKDRFSLRAESPDSRPGQEVGSIVKNWQRHKRIALVYPNTYPVGMTNLGLQRLYQVFNEQEEFLCERVFLPQDALAGERSSLRSCESQRPLQDFDVIAFSISFETDYVNVLRALDLAGIPLYHQERREGAYPLIVGGGCGITVNPEPLAPFIDLFCIGEGEDFVEPFCEKVLNRAHESLEHFLENCADLPGVYVPSFFQFSFDGSRVKEIQKTGPGPKKILRLITKNLNLAPTQTVVVPSESPFRNMYLVETGRGCKWACRFCAAGYIYRYPRERGLEELKKACDRGLDMGMRIGLVGSDMSCHSYIGQLMEYILDRGGIPSLSSIRVEAVDKDIARIIGRTGIKTMTLAPDAGSFRLRRVLNKNMTDEMIVESAERVLEQGVRNIKLYFIIGLPTEGDEDIEQLIELAQKVRAIMKKRAAVSKQMGLISLSINPFIPKPGTPFQWVGLEPEKVILKRFQRIRKVLVPQGNFKIELESYRSCYLQAFVTRGDRRVGKILEHMYKSGRSVDHAAKDLSDRLHYNPAEQVHRTWEHSEILPWDHMDHGFEAGYLAREMLRGYQTKLIPLCQPETCKLCGVC